ncbi:Uncharacterized protein Fot_22710 [Forsythia ovata]|uniref:Uncharacterized protein n=1 Tax=Forsythia ovata TaxID=205694 RepID=A0ABD1UYH4_9LAMI
MEENYVQKRRASFAALHEMSGALMPDAAIPISWIAPDHLEDLHFGEGQNFVSDVEAEKLLKLEMFLDELGWDIETSIQTKYYIGILKGCQIYNNSGCAFPPQWLKGPLGSIIAFRFLMLSHLSLKVLA